MVVVVQEYSINSYSCTVTANDNSSVSSITDRAFNSVHIEILTKNYNS